MQMRQRHILFQRYRLWTRLRIDAGGDELLFREESAQAITYHLASL